MKEYYIEINERYVQIYKRKKAAFNWVEKYIEQTKNIDLEAYPELIRIWEHDTGVHDCIFETKRGNYKPIR